MRTGRMNRVFLRLLLALSFAAVSSPAPAQFNSPAPAQYILAHGFGSLSCREFLAAQPDTALGLQQRLQFRQWIMGFVSAISVYAPAGSTKLGMGTNNAVAAMQFVNEYCKLEPSHRVVVAVAGFVQGTGGPKMPGSWSLTGQ